MDLSVSKFRAARAVMALLSLTMGAGALHATNLLNPTATASVSCSTATGPGTAASITVKPLTALTGTNTITVAFVAPGSGLVVTAPGTQVLSTSNQTAGLTYTVNTAANCVGATSGSVTLQFKAGAGSATPATDATTTVTDTVSTSTSGLSVAPATVAVTCTYIPPVGNGSATYSPGPAQTVSVTTSASAGIPYSLDTTSANDPAWLTIAPTAPTGTAGSSAQTFTVAAASGCGGYALNSVHNVNLHLINAPAPDKLIPVSLQIVPQSPLTVTPVPSAPSISLSYTKGSGATASANVSVTSTVSGAYISINTATLPSWLTVDNISGTAPWSLRFSTTSLTDTLAPGSYTASVYFQVSGYAALAVPVTLLVNNKAPTLSVNATQVPINWTLNAPLPTATIIATSSDSPIQYTITTGGALQPSVATNQQSGLAYDFGTDILVSFGQQAFAAAQPGQVLTGTVTLTWGSGSTTVVTFLVTVVSPGATVTGITPASLPTAASGTRFTLNISGTGFVGGSNAALATRVGIVVNNTIVPDTNLSISVVNPSNITLTIAVPTTADQYLPFSTSGTGGAVSLGVVNGNSSSIPTGTAQITIGAGPIIQGATSASAFTEVTPPTLPTFAPYDIISLFGANFCGTACGTSTTLTGSPDTLTERFPTSLSPDAAGPTQRLITVSFLAHGTTTVIGTAPLLFASTSQINLIVPAAVSSYVGAGTVDIVVGFGYGSGATLLQSSPFNVNIAAADPGIFTIGSDGQGAGAILNASWALVGSSNPAGMRTGGNGTPDSDTVQIFMTGLGAPTSTADNTATGSSTYPTDCIAATGSTSYESVLQSTTGVSPALTSIDGAVIQSSLVNTGRYAPCLTTNPTVKIGGVSASVTYAGFVEDSVAGLYQINAQLPSSVGTFYPNYPSTTSPLTNVTVPVQLPVQVTVGSGVSQTGVTVWVAPSLNVTAPTGSALDATVGISWSGTVAATEGTGTITYSLASGLLPNGLTLNAGTGVISGRPGPGTAGSWTVTVKATDSASTPVTGTVSFTIVVAGGLYMTSTGSAPFNSVYGTAVPTFTVTATGGTYPYSYALSYAGAGTPMGVSVGLHTGVMTLPATLPAGTYHVTLTATDSSTNPLTGTYNFDVIVALHVTEAAGSGSTLAVITATGGSGTLLYSLDSASTTAGLAIDTSGNLTAGGASSSTYSVTVTVTDSVTLAPGASVEGTGSVGPFSVTF